MPFQQIFCTFLSYVLSWRRPSLYNAWAGPPIICLFVVVSKFLTFLIRSDCTSVVLTTNHYIHIYYLFTFIARHQSLLVCSYSNHFVLVYFGTVIINYFQVKFFPAHLIYPWSSSLPLSILFYLSITIFLIHLDTPCSRLIGINLCLLD